MYSPGPQPASWLPAAKFGGPSLTTRRMLASPLHPGRWWLLSGTEYFKHNSLRTNGRTYWRALPENRYPRVLRSCSGVVGLGLGLGLGLGVVVKILLALRSGRKIPAHLRATAFALRPSRQATVKSKRVTPSPQNTQQFYSVRTIPSYHRYSKWRVLLIEVAVGNSRNIDTEHRCRLITPTFNYSCQSNDHGKQACGICEFKLRQEDDLCLLPAINRANIINVINVSILFSMAESV